jgi:hypothetical protein
MRQSPIFAIRMDALQGARDIHSNADAFVSSPADVTDVLAVQQSLAPLQKKLSILF